MYKPRRVSGNYIAYTTNITSVVFDLVYLKNVYRPYKEIHHMHERVDTLHFLGR